MMRNAVLEGMKVLLVDDSQDNQLLMIHILKAAGADTTLANNGLEAVEKTKAIDFDVVLMDLQMPVMDGYEALETMRASGYSGPVWAVTAHAFSEIRRRCKDKGFDEYLTKPIDTPMLISQIASLRHS